ncbi:hypothetical protein CEXT_446821 [Caerostris extrusa]|uniref:Uncharacterized protein n=1 Tax=Caerostris extrusa TaxID=172846 RepID=A0AAV4SVF5_CAEEX|nr:hypothetical protein CEXT_446821 [Caerostris extrusa]
MVIILRNTLLGIPAKVSSLVFLAYDEVDFLYKKRGVQRRKDDEKMELKNATTNCRMRDKLASALMRIYFALHWTFIYHGFITCVSHRANKEEIGVDFPHKKMGVQRKKDDEKMELKKAAKNANHKLSNARQAFFGAYEDLFRHVLDIYLPWIYTCVSHRTNKGEIGERHFFFFFPFRIAIRIMRLTNALYEFVFEDT